MGRFGSSARVSEVLVEFPANMDRRAMLLKPFCSSTTWRPPEKCGSDFEPALVGVISCSLLACMGDKEGGVSSVTSALLINGARDRAQVQTL
jgi:hypothetical protein